MDEYLYTVIRHLNRERFAPSVLVPRTSAINERYTSMSIPVLDLGLRTNGYCARDILSLNRVVKQFDVIYGNSICRSTRNVGLAARLARKPFIWHVYEVLTVAHSSLGRLLRIADQVIAVSQACHNSLSPFLKANVPIINNPFDMQRLTNDSEQHAAARSVLLDKYSLPADASLCLTIGRISEAKGIDLLLQIAARIVMMVPQAFFFVIGNWKGSQEEVLSQRKLLGLEQNVIFPGFQDDTLPFLRGADILLHPSRFESFGRVIAEALACKVPAVAFNLGGIAEVLEDGKSGFLIPPFDVDLFSQKAKVLLCHKNLRETMGNAGSAYVQAQFSIPKSVENFENIITKVYLSRPKSRY